MSLAIPIAASFRFTNPMVQLVLNAVNEEQAVRRSRGGEGPSMAWHIGHLLHYRCMALNSFGLAKESPYKELFSDQGASDGAGYPSVAELQAQWNAIAGEIEAAAGAATEESLNQVAPFPGPHGKQKVLDAMTFFNWHESYHMGGLSAVMKDIGLPGVADLVMAQMGIGS